eukprot:3910431-Rhodomonas_salina.1
MSGTTTAMCYAARGTDARYAPRPTARTGAGVAHQPRYAQSAILLRRSAVPDTLSGCGATRCLVPSSDARPDAHALAAQLERLGAHIPVWPYA